MKESDLFGPVKNFLFNAGCTEVYGEVALFDVLALSGSCNICVELKNNLSFKLLDQAMDRLRYVEYVYVAIPKRKSRVPRSAEMIMKKNKIGLLEVDGTDVSIIIPARYSRISRYLRTELNYDVRKNIKEYHKNEVGGVKSGEGITEYSLMIDRIKQFLRFNGESSIDEILENCETHYANPRPSLAATLRAAWNDDWCEIIIKNKKIYYKLKQKSCGTL